VTWFRSQSRPAPRIVVITSVYTFSPLVEHFVHWYSRPELDVDNIVICVTEKTREAVTALRNERCVLHTIPEIPQDPTNFDTYKDREELGAWEKLRFTGDDYKLAVDLDEFQSYPWSLREIVNEMTARNEWALAGILVDRLARDYSTPAIKPLREATLDRQFPVVRQWPLRDWPELLDQKTPWGACVTKVAVCRGAVELASGRHHAKNAVIARHAQFGFFATDLKVHHFRWAAGAVESLASRAEDPRFTDRYRAECVEGKRWLLEQQEQQQQRVRGLRSRGGQ
jgi:hypothetical protein